MDGERLELHAADPVVLAAVVNLLALFHAAESRTKHEPALGHHIEAGQLPDEDVWAVTRKAA